MTSYKQTQFPGLVAGSTTCAQPPGVGHDDRQITLTGVADWIALCQRCARVEDCADMVDASGTHSEPGAVIISLKLRRMT